MMRGGFAALCGRAPSGGAGRRPHTLRLPPNEARNPYTTILRPCFWGLTLNHVSTFNALQIQPRSTYQEHFNNQIQKPNAPPQLTKPSSKKPVKCVKASSSTPHSQLSPFYSRFSVPPADFHNHTDLKSKTD